MIGNRREFTERYNEGGYHGRPGGNFAGEKQWILTENI